MKSVTVIFRAAVSIAALFAVLACAGGGKIPMKVYSNLDIPDGEYLHYGYYYRGEKALDNYMVTRKITNGMGGFSYLIYFDMISVSVKEGPAKDYTKWPMFFLVDPLSGSLVESVIKYSTNSPGINGVIYSHYRLLKGYVEYITRSLKNHETNENRYRVNVKPGFPSWDMWSSIYFTLRFLDVRSPGVEYVIIPEVMKEPIPFSAVYLGKETIKTGAGSFDVIKAKMPMGDPFLGRLLDPMMGNAYSMIEDSDRRLVVKIGAADNGNVLEEISNVNDK